ncbi:50S ribosomal protein L17 [bacterium]|nr:50S ribosomal protein L17 [bacterium]
MRHRRDPRKLGGTTDRRKLLLRNLTRSLIMNERIRTTVPRCKELQRFIEPLITRARKDTVHNRRMVGRVVTRRDALSVLFDEIAPRFVERPGGYTRIIRLGQRPTDGAEMGLIEFVEKAKAAAEPAAETA